MKRIALGILLASLFGVAQADTTSLVVHNGSSVNFSNYSGQPLTVTGMQNTGSWGSLFANEAGTFFATYLGNESGFPDNFTFGFGNGNLLETNALGTTISQNVTGAGTVAFSFGDKDNGGVSHLFSNGQAQTLPLGFVIMNGQENGYGKFDYLLGFNDSATSDAGLADYDDFVVGVNFVAAVPEPETYAMLLAGLGLLGMSVRRRKSGMFD